MPSEVSHQRVPNLVLTWERECRNWTQEELADQITQAGARQSNHHAVCDVRMVVRWENGEVLWPRRVYRELLEEVFGKPITEIGFVRRWKRTPTGLVVVSTATVEGSASESRSPDHVKRREFLHAALGLGVALTDHPEVFLVSEADHALGGGSQRRIGARHVREAEELLKRLNALDHDQGGTSLLEQALNAVKAVRLLLDRSGYTDDVGRRLETVAGELLILAGWLSYDAGLQEQARYLYSEAFLAGRTSGCDVVSAHALSNMSIQANALDRPREAVRLARSAQEHARGWATGRVHSVFAIHEARGLARMDVAAECKDALGRSTDFFDQGPDDDDPHWIGYLNEPEFATLKGVCHMDLGEAGTARELLRQGADLHSGTFVRNRSSSATSYMRALLRDKELDEACRTAADAYPVISQLSSVRILNQFREFCRELAPYENEPAVRSFLMLLAGPGA